MLSEIERGERFVGLQLVGNAAISCADEIHYLRNSSIAFFPSGNLVAKENLYNGNYVAIMNRNSVIYLASCSPRRRELLMQLGLPIELITTEVDESQGIGEDAVTYTQRLAQTKAQVGWDDVMHMQRPRYPLLAADTTVALHGVLYGKPANQDEARFMLETFSAQTHQVITTVAVTDGERLHYKTSVTDVFFRPLSYEDIQRYIDSGEPFDKAGGYGIQGQAAVFIKKINGSFTGVMGLPLFETAALLAEFGYVFP